MKRSKVIAPRHLAVFTRQFSVMIDAGLPLVQCLEILGAQEEDKHFAAVIAHTRADVERGASLAAAMKKHPAVFDALYSNMIAAGEAGGALDTILGRLATHVEKSAKLKAQVRSAMIYPAAVALFAAAVVAVILWQVIPAFASLFTGLDTSLPLPTRVVIAASALTVQLAPYLFGTSMLLAYGLKRYHATEPGQLAIDRILLSLPLVGPVLRKIAVARFCRTLSTLIASGVPILDGLEITARTSGNRVIERAVRTTRRSIEEGATVSGPLGRTGVFPGMVVQMIGVGEATGALDAMLAKIADFYEDDVDRSVGGLLTMLEPAMIAFLGIVVGGIVISMYLPIFELISELAG